MKTFHKTFFFALLLASGIGLQNCKDNILTPVTNNKAADSLVSQINALNTKLVIVNAKDNSLQIQLSKFGSKRDSLNAISNYNNSYAQSVQYTVYVVDGSNTVSGVYSGSRVTSACKDCKVSGVDGASVTVSSNGQTYTATSTDGRAIFNNLYVAGLATVTISLKGYTGCTFTTYFNPATCSSCSIPSVSQTGAVINASTHAMLIPTAGTSVTTYTGQLYINKSSMDDTLGRLYKKPTDLVKYNTFISSNGPYHGINYTNNLNSEIPDYTQNQYYIPDLESESYAPPQGAEINFTKLTSLAGNNYVYGYPTNISTYYDVYGSAYQYLPGDIISITYTGLTSFANIDATGKYVLKVPSYENAPGTTIGAIAGLNRGGSGGNLIHYQDNYTYLTTASDILGSTHPTIKFYNNVTYAVTPITGFYQVTTMFEFYPYIETDDSDYRYIGGGSSYTQTFHSTPGQTVNRNIFFFAAQVTGK
jgi:hypothetical protein